MCVLIVYELEKIDLFCSNEVANSWVLLCPCPHGQLAKVSSRWSSHLFTVWRNTRHSTISYTRKSLTLSSKPHLFHSQLFHCFLQRINIKCYQDITVYNCISSVSPAKGVANLNCRSPSADYDGNSRLSYLNWKKNQKF